ncbi:radical SAM family heme chaperone HemW [Albibacterium indicum]|uniref:radical SAM family heme chaperone HemW n=1 Tax=Albibacterium indicum TaxID=2292082 RepID=UPI000E4C736F|nr:radical SAM family heme chaperone HemW [Pedobacter indicus]
MAGIYIHIPFCKQACHYCDFHFSTSMRHKDDMVSAILQEIELRKNYLENTPIKSIYFGGGTPSLLSSQEINRIIDMIYHTQQVENTIEITLEANPDDLTAEKVKDLRGTPVNRFSIGVQSFYEEDLRWMNRAHNAQEAESSIKRAQDAGFTNITCDLIYGYPLLSDTKWINNIDRMAEFEVPHLSAYSMTVEPQTALGAFIRKGTQQPMNEGQSADQFILLMQKMGENGYEQYEISNFARNQQYSKHNTSYWQGVPYIGIGPSAHSFNGRERQWNVANNMKYLQALADKQIPAEKEILRESDKFNEYIMTSLRTKWGVDYAYLEKTFDSDFLLEMRKPLDMYIDKGKIENKEGHYVLTEQGKLIADQIASDLFITF